MKLFLLSCLATLSLTALVGCSSDNDKHYSSTSTYESATVDTKAVHHRNQ